MAWNPYTDQKNRAYSGILTTLFPEQTKTLPRIIVWSIIFFLDLTIGIFAAVHFGLLQPGSFNSTNDMMLGSLLILAAIFAIFWLQGKIWFGIVNFFKNRNKLD